MRRFLLVLLTFFSLFVNAQDGESFLYVDDFRILGPEHTLILPEGMRKNDINGNPWAMVKIVAKGFDSKILNDIIFYSPSSTLCIENTQYVSEEGCYKIILSSGVKGKLVFRYQGATLEHQLPKLTKNRVYQLDLTMRSANLTIIATPTNAKIFIDGEEKGFGGIANVNLRMGEHNYSVVCDDYLTENKTIWLAKNEAIKVDLSPLFGYISVTSEPSGAEVYINGVMAGMTPYLMKKIKRGRNNIELKMTGYYDRAELVDINIGDNKSLEFEMISYNDATVQMESRKPLNPTLRLSDDTLFFDSEPSKDSIFVTTNSLGWNFMDVPRWLSVFKRNNILYVTCMKNRVHDSRETDITVYTDDGLSKNLHIYQDVGKTVLNTFTRDIDFESAKDSAIRLIEANVSNWMIETSAPWINAHEKGDTLLVICDENPWPVSRYGVVNVRANDKELTFNVSQTSHVTVINVPNEDIVMESFGGSMAIPVGSDADEWSCSSNDEWIKVSHSGDALLLECAPNEGAERRGSYIIRTDTKIYRINVVQKGAYEVKPVVVIDSKPDWATIYIDGKQIGRTPLRVAADDSIHYVRLGKEERCYVFNKQTKKVKFNTGLKYIEATMSGETFGVRSGFIKGESPWGGYNHLQMKLGNWDFSPTVGKGPLYVYSLGASYEILPWMSAYAGAGIAVSNDSLRYEYPDGIIIRNSFGDLKLGAELETGLLFYYYRVFGSLGLQYNNIGLDKQHLDFSIGLGTYFNRYYDNKYGYCSNMSRRWWSLNIIYNPGRNGFGFMFNDVGKRKTRWYIKAMSEFLNYKKQVVGEINEGDTMYVGKRFDEINPGLTTGVSFNIIPGNIDFMVGAGYQMTVLNGDVEGKGIQAEIGFVINIWRFPFTIMMRGCELEKDSRFLTVDFGIGFNFGEFLTDNKKER